jgi:hypothetical protein
VRIAPLIRIRLGLRHLPAGVDLAHGHPQLHGTPYSSAASSNSATRDDPGEGILWARTLPAPMDPSKTTPRSPAPLTFRKPRRSSALGAARGGDSGDRSVPSEHIPPPRSVALLPLLLILCTLRYENYTNARERQSKIGIVYFPPQQYLPGRRFLTHNMLCPLVD